MSQAQASPARRWAEAILDLFYPPHCAACGRLGAWLCDRCLARLVRDEAAHCPLCGRQLAALEPCAGCSALGAALAGACSVGPHLPPLRQALHALKYEGARVLARPLAELAAATLDELELRADALVPVPLHPARQRQRGYNQAELLARELSARSGLSLEVGLLARQRDTPPQVGLTRSQRRSNVEGAFACPEHACTGRRLILVDDVHTTGATLEAAARALRAAGAAEVWGLTIARALAPGVRPTEGKTTP